MRFTFSAPEDGSIEQSIVNVADAVVYVPTIGCMNLAATVNVLLYDRMAKQEQTIDHSERVKKSRDVNNRLVFKGGSPDYLNKLRHQSPVSSLLLALQVTSHLSITAAFNNWIIGKALLARATGGSSSLVTLAASVADGCLLLAMFVSS